MIAYLKGEIIKKLPKAVIIEAASVGYLVHVSALLLEKVSTQKQLELFIHTRVREDDISLYGFEKFEELEFFQTLLSVNGIGPKIGLELLACDVNKTKAALMTGNIDYLSKIPGIGNKTAQRLIVELKNKVSLEDMDRLHTTLEPSGNNEAIEALAGLGYQKFEIMRKLKGMPETITITEEIITYFLKNS